MSEKVKSNSTGALKDFFVKHNREELIKARLKSVQASRKVPYELNSTKYLLAATPAALYQCPTDEKQNNDDAIIQGFHQEFPNDLLSILNDTPSSDVTIKSGTTELKTHKIILIARSPVFKAMFGSDMQESAGGTVSIDDIEPETVRDMLFFIYSNQVQNLSLQKACDLLDAAEKYQLQSLKRICVDFLTSSLSLANAFLVLQTADLYDGSLKSRTMEFIRDEFRDLKATEEWKTV